MTVQPLNPALRSEADLANAGYAPYAHRLEINRTMFHRYDRPSELTDWRQMAALLAGDVRDKAFLDLGCGMGGESLYFAKLGARVTAIDISDVAISSLRHRAAFHRLPIEALQMRCDPTEFADASFDHIHGHGILYRVGFGRGLSEVHRLLRPGGTAVFLEPLGDSPFLESTRDFLLRRSRYAERSLTWAEIDVETRRFARTVAFPYHLLSRLKPILPNLAHEPLRRLDHALLTLAPRLRRYAGGVALRVTKAH